MRTLFRRCSLPTWALLAWLVVTPFACAGNLTTLSGTTYHQIRVVRIEPDGIIWTHATGICKVDFTDLPEAVRKMYHYDARQAAAFQAAQALVRQQADLQAQRNQQEASAWRTRQLQTQAAAIEADASSGRFLYHRRAAEQAVGEQIAAKKAEHDLLTRDDGTLWDRRLWAVPSLFTGVYSLGVAFDPRTDLNAHEFQAGLHHAPGEEFAPDSAHDDFFKPDYLTKAYDQDVERAKAFARGHP